MFSNLFKRLLILCSGSNLNPYAASELATPGSHFGRCSSASYPNLRFPFEPLVCVIVLRTRSRNKAAVHGALHTSQDYFTYVLRLRYRMLRHHLLSRLQLSALWYLRYVRNSFPKYVTSAVAAKTLMRPLAGAAGAMLIVCVRGLTTKRFFRVGSLQLTPLRLRLADVTMG